MGKKNRIEVSDSANVSVVRFRDQKIIDPESIQELGQELFDLIEQDERSKLYRLSIEFFALAANAGNPGDLRTLCRPGQPSWRRREEPGRTPGGSSGSATAAATPKDLR